MATKYEITTAFTMMWNHMSLNWRASIQLNGCVTNPCLIGDAHCFCWRAAQRAAAMQRHPIEFELPVKRIW